MIPCVRFKPTVILGEQPTPCQARLITAIDLCARLLGVELTLTCGREGHIVTDPHTRGLALDVSVANLAMDQIDKAYFYLRSVLGDLFTVLYEVPTEPADPRLKAIAFLNAQATAPHFHVQRKKGTSFPPALASSPS